MNKLIGLVIGCLALCVIWSIASNSVRALVGAYRYGSIKAGFFGGTTVYRSIQPARFWWIAGWQMFHVVWIGASVVALIASVAMSVD